MGSDEIQITEIRRTEDKLPNDVARLYSWANVEDAQYHDFSRYGNSRHRRVRHNPTPPAESPQNSAVPFNSNQPTDVFQNRSKAPKIPVANTTPPNPYHLAFSETIANPSAQASFRREDSAEECVTLQPRGIPAESSTDWSVIDGRAYAEFDDFRPVVAVYSLAGGVGKTTLCANLGQALRSAKDRVLLIDASGSGILPFYFGANNSKPTVHTFAAPGGLSAPLRVIDSGTISAAWLENEVRPEIEASDWTIFDLGPASAHMLPRIFAMSSILLVPLLPDLNSILTISRLESSLRAMRFKNPKIPTPFYILNQFDLEDPVDREARSLILRECGGRLLPFSIAQDSEAARAIAARKTVIDYAPESEIAIACERLAALLRTSAIASQSRWSPNSCAQK